MTRSKSTAEDVTQELKTDRKPSKKGSPKKTKALETKTTDDTKAEDPENGDADKKMDIEPEVKDNKTEEPAEERMDEDKN